MSTKKTYVCLIEGNDSRSKLYKWILKSKDTHVFFLYESDLWGGWFAADIMEDGVIMLPEEKSSTQRATTLTFFECSMPLDVGFKRARKFVDSGYDFLALFANLMRIMLWRWFGWKWLKPVGSSKRMYCAEFVATIFRLADIPHSEELDPEVTSPGMLREFMVNSIYFDQVDNPIKKQDA
jgi:hypothetical protein